MGHVILGLLMLRQMSLYDLVKAFEAGVSLFYSASTGSIKRALDGLLTQGDVEVASVESGGRGRKTHRVTEQGRERFRAWMLAAPTGDLETAALSRLFFLGLMPADDRPAVLAGIESRIEADLNHLEAMRAHIEQIDVPDEWRDLANYQWQTLQYGLASHRFALDWFRRMPETLELRPPDAD